MTFSLHHFMYHHLYRGVEYLCVWIWYRPATTIQINDPPTLYSLAYSRGDFCWLSKQKTASILEPKRAGTVSVVQRHEDSLSACVEDSCHELHWFESENRCYSCQGRHWYSELWLAIPSEQSLWNGESSMWWISQSLTRRLISNNNLSHQQRLQSDRWAHHK